MSDIQLSKDNDILICSLYKHYLEKVKNGSSKSDARLISSSDELQETLLNTWSKDDVATTCWELHSKGLLECTSGDDIANDIYLTNEGIIYMENRFKNGIIELTDFITKFIP